ncbi:MAG: ATP-binding cassette domain-containing protein [Saprospiraceae bacterium]|nr:ATP-binding cassette domain-containing protein [Saprospiraceae bacterium]
MLQTHSLRKNYSANKKILFPDIRLANAEQLLIHGPSGCGKTTLLHLLCGILKPTSGSIRFGEQDYSDLKGSQMDAFRGQYFGVCLQRPVFIQSLTSLENLLFTLQLAGKKPDREYCIAQMQTLGISHTAHQMCGTLSPGEQQRLMFLKALIHRPKCIIADEPSSSLDDVNAQSVIDLLISQCKSSGAMLIVVSHDSRIKSVFPNQISLS